MSQRLALYITLLTTNTDRNANFDLYLAPQTLFETIAYDNCYHETLAKCIAHSASEVIVLNAN